MAKKHIDIKVHEFEPLRHISVKPSTQEEIQKIKLSLKERNNNYNFYETHSEQELKESKKNFKENVYILRLRDSMQDYVYLRIKQIMIDLGIVSTEISESIIIKPFFFHINQEHLTVKFNAEHRYNENNNFEIVSSCPFFEEPHNIKTYSYGTHYVSRYIEFCNCVLSLLEKLELYDIALKQTIERAEKCVIRTEKTVLIEKIKRI